MFDKWQKKDEKKTKENYHTTKSIILEKKMRYFCLLAIAATLAACRSGTILEGDKPNYTKSDKQVYWADSDYKGAANSATISSQTIVSAPNIQIEPSQPSVPNANVISVPADQYQYQYRPMPNIQLPVEVSRQLYTVLGSRTINKMLMETSDLYKDNKPNLFIALPTLDMHNVALSSPEYAEVVAEDIIVGSNAYNIVHSSDQADYILYTYISDANVQNGSKPVVVYRNVLKDRQNKQIGTWAESVSQIANDDKSWW